MTGLKLRAFKDHRRYDFHRTFGTTAQLADCEFDTGLSNFNQNEPNPVTGDPALPEGCTAFARADIATNEDRIVYKPGFTYSKTCLIEGVAEGQPCTLESSFKSGVVYGLQAIGETTDAQALAHRRGPYFEVTQLPGQDWFDSLWSALLKAQKGLSVGTVWYPEMTTAQIVDSVAIRSTTDGHDWEVTGVATQDGVPRMHVKWWGGEPKWFGRAAINALMAASGSDCLVDTDGKATPADIQTVKLTIMETLLSYLQRLLAAFAPQSGALPPNPTPMEETIYQKAKASLGKHMTLNASVPAEVGCAEAVSAVLSLAGVSDGAAGIAGTASLYNWLLNCGRFDKVDAPSPGSIIISPTGMGNGNIPGHTGIVGTSGIMSNDSNSGLFLELWTLPKWKEYYGSYGGLPIAYFNLRG